MPEITLFFIAESDADAFVQRFRNSPALRQSIGALTAEDGKRDIHQPSGLALVRANNLPTVLTQMSGVTEILDVMADHWDSGDLWGSAMAAMFGLADALRSLDEDVPVDYSPGAWDGTFMADDFRSGGPGGDHSYAVEFLQQMDGERGPEQMREVLLVLDGYSDELKAQGHSY